MQMIIYALVEASTRYEAISNGKTVFDRLVGAYPESSAVFDYYVSFTQEDAGGNGATRWEDLPAAAPVDSDEGQALLDRGWNATREEFQRNLDRVKEALAELDDEAIMRDERLSRHAFHQVGAYSGPSIFLYDEHATGIRHREQLDRVLERGGERWIVPAEVQF